MIKKEEKGRLRKLALSNRNSLAAVERMAAATAIAEKLMTLPEVVAAEMVMCYMDFRSEVSTQQIVENFKEIGKRLCFPLCEKQGIMHAWEPVDENSWKNGYMGIREPNPSCSKLISPEDIDLVICPVVAFDESKHRIGYGGGYYDRFLPQCKKAVFIGVAFEAQKIDAVPCEEFDRAMDYIITEKRIY